MNHNNHIRTEVSAVGIDVAKATLSVCLRSREGGEDALTIRNIETEIKEKLMPRLMGYRGKIVMESTGHYHWLTALRLAEAGFDVRVVNPLLAKQYTAGTIRKVKTDPADAAGLARMAAVADNLPPQFLSTRAQLQSRKKLAVIASMTHQLQALHAALASMREANAVLGVADSPAEQEVGNAVAMPRRAVMHLEQEFVRESGRVPETAARAALAASIPGVSPFCAHLAVHWFDRVRGDTAKAWIAFAGLDISSRESGTWRGRCHLTKRGNGYLRRRLYSAAWGAVMHDAQMKTYYDALRAQGRVHVEALVIIARKIVRTMFMVLATGLPYDPSRLQSQVMIAATA